MSPARTSAKVAHAGREVRLEADVDLDRRAPGSIPAASGRRCRRSPGRCRSGRRRARSRGCAPVADLGRGDVEPHERRRIDRGPELGERNAGGEMRGGRSEDVAPVEGPRHRRQAVRLVSRARPPPRLRPACRRRRAGGRCRARRRPGRARARAIARRSPPTSGSTTARCTPAGKYGSVFASTSAPWSTCWRSIPCVMSIISTPGRDPLDDAVADADEVVLEAEIGQEGDDVVRDAASLTASASPARSCVSASATTPSPPRARPRT